MPGVTNEPREPKSPGAAEWRIPGSASAGSSSTEPEQQKEPIVMNYITRNVLETAIRVLAFKTEPGVPTTNVRANALFASLGTEVTAMETHGTAQAAGAGVMH